MYIYVCMYVIVNATRFPPRLIVSWRRRPWRLAGGEPREIDWCRGNFLNPNCKVLFGCTEITFYYTMLIWKSMFWSLARGGRRELRSALEGQEASSWLLRARCLKIWPWQGKSRCWHKKVMEIVDPTFLKLLFLSIRCFGKYGKRRGNFRKSASH